MFSVAGGCATVLALDVTVILAPEAGAAFPRVTVAVTLLPPVTELRQA